MFKTFVADGDLAGSVTVKEYEGRYFPPDMPDIPSHLKRLQSFDADASDVIICAYPKSGFHWIWDVMTMLINNTSRISKELPGKYSLELGVRKMEQIPPPRVLGSHLYYEELPASIRQKKCKIINVIRDPRAVAVSSYHFFTKIKESKWNGTWAGYLNLFLNGKVLFNDWFTYTQLWERVRQNNLSNPTHVMFYEDAIQNPFNEFKRLARFLQLDVKESMIRTIAEQTKFSNLQTFKEAAIGHHPLAGSFFTGNKYPLYRKGTKDDWKSLFTLQQNAEFEQIYKERMQYNKLQLKSIVNPGSNDTGCVMCVEDTRYGSKL
ncbi:sulfotransferase 1B1-like isoform X1 [Mytilus edulis]|uniref:sulfotransferase 1B1-like isoform X1 n=1 Tax=Mytilus edulis TaxID=6550 RepID=UPI0039F09716